jgi:ATP-dependent DNA helicase RecQ
LPKIVLQMLRPYSCQHLEDKLSVIAKNSSPNASPVQLLVVSGNNSCLFPVPSPRCPMPFHSTIVAIASSIPGGTLGNSRQYPAP